MEDALARQELPHSKVQPGIFVGKKIKPVGSGPTRSQRGTHCTTKLRADWLSELDTPKE